MKSDQSLPCQFETSTLHSLVNRQITESSLPSFLEISLNKKKVVPFKWNDGLSDTHVLTASLISSWSVSILTGSGEVAAGVPVLVLLPFSFAFPFSVVVNAEVLKIEISDQQMNSSEEIIFKIPHKSICCWYSLELSRQGSQQAPPTYVSTHR